MMRYLERIGTLFYFLCNGTFFKQFSYRSLVYKPCRINGKKYISVGKRTVIQKYSWILALKIDEYDPQLVIGDNCDIGDFSHIVAVRKVIIEKNVLMANKVYISDNYHCFDDIQVPIKEQKVCFKSEVYIGEGSWIGENVCIMSARIGKNSIIGANSVVTSDIPDYSVAVGCPARVIKRFDLLLNKWIFVS